MSRAWDWYAAPDQALRDERRVHRLFWSLFVNAIVCLLTAVTVVLYAPSVLSSLPTHTYAPVFADTLYMDTLYVHHSVLSNGTVCSSRPRRTP